IAPSDFGRVLRVVLAPPLALGADRVEPLGGALLPGGRTRFDADGILGEELIQNDLGLAFLAERDVLLSDFECRRHVEPPFVGRAYCATSLLPRAGRMSTSVIAEPDVAIERSVIRSPVTRGPVTRGP